MKNNNNYFTILADVPPVPDKTQLKTYKKCGFNTYLFTEDHICYENNKELYKDKIRLADSLGLNVWIRGYNDNQRHPNYFDKFSDFDFHDFKNITGLYFVDEPVIDNLIGFQEICIPFYNQKYNDLFWHINLLPSYTCARSLYVDEPNSTSAFEKYIKQYTSMIKEVNGEKDVSIDHYPLFTKDGKDYITDSWLYDMTVVSNEAKKIGAKTTNCVQAFSDIGYRIFSTQKEMNFLVSMQLAFGTVIFEFFLYNRIKGQNNWIPIVDDNKPTYVYKISKNAIKMIKRYNDVFSHIAWQGINFINGSQKEQTLNFLHITDGSISKTDLPWTKTNPAFEMIKDRTLKIKDINISSNFDTLIGIFNNSDNDGKSYFITPFTEPKKNYRNTITINTVNKPINKLYINGKRKIILNKNKITLELKSGDNALIRTK